MYEQNSVEEPLVDDEAFPDTPKLFTQVGQSLATKVLEFAPFEQLPDLFVFVI